MHPIIRGIAASIDSDETGATAHHHVILAWRVDLLTKQTIVTVGGYVSAAAFDAGRRWLMHTTLTLNAVPADGDALAWLYGHIVAVPSSLPEGANPAQPGGNPFAGAQLVMTEAVAE